jgi:hypothetical protein
MDVGIWLRNLALGQYESLFEDDETDSGVSHSSTSQLPPASPLELRLTEALEREAATAEILRVSQVRLPILV